MVSRGGRVGGVVEQHRIGDPSIGRHRDGIHRVEKQVVQFGRERGIQHVEWAQRRRQHHFLSSFGRLIHTLRKSNAMCVCALGAQIVCLLKTGVFLLCVFVSDDLFTYAYEHTKKRQKKTVETPTPPIPPLKNKYILGFQIPFFLFLCVCVRLRIDDHVRTLSLSLERERVHARACPARRPQKKARRGRGEEEEEEVGCFFRNDAE